MKTREYYINKSFMLSIYLSLFMQFPLKFIFYDKLPTDSLEMRITKLLIILFCTIICFIISSVVTSIITINYLNKNFGVKETSNGQE